MIRVNLLPHKKGGRGGGGGGPLITTGGVGGSKWLLVVLGVLILEGIGLFLFHQTKQSELSAQNQKNGQLQGQIADIQQLVSNHKAIQDALVLLRAREDAIAKLQSARTGPTAVLLELAQLLTRGKGPTADPDKLQQLKKDNPLAVYNPGWDSRRLWLTNYTEGERVVRIEGQARDGSDVSEFAQRLKLSVYVYDVTLLPGKKQSDKDKLEVVDFALQLKVRY